MILLRRSTAPLAASAILLASGSAWGEPTRELFIRDTQEIFRGDPISSRLTARGRIRMGLRQNALAEALDAPVTAVLRQGNTLVVGTAGKGLFRLEPGGEPVALTDEGVITAVASLGKDVLFATAADGVIQRVRGSEVERWSEVEARYVWALASQGSDIYAVTGDPGRLVQLTPGKSTTLFEAEEKHLRSLAIIDSDDMVFGGGERGIVYRRTGKSVRALYDSGLEETTALAFDPGSGDIFAGFSSSREKGRLPAFRWIGSVGDDTGSDSPFKGGELVKIDGRGRVEIAWRGAGEGLLALASTKDGVVFTTGTAPDDRARLYRLAREGSDRLELVARFESSLATAVVPRDDGAFLVGTSGELLQVGPSMVKEAEYTSVEQDFQRVARVGRLWFEADVPQGAAVAVSFRTGNTSEVDATWSEWSKPVGRTSGAKVDVPVGRYGQFRVRMKGGRSGAEPQVRSLHASVVRLNDPPEIHEVFALRRGTALDPLPPNGDRDKTLTLSPASLNKLRPEGPPSDPDRDRARQSNRDGFLTVAWHAVDTNGDRLTFSVDMQPVGGTGWVRLGENLEMPFLSIDSRSFPDGDHMFRVTASDRPSNPPGEALTATRISEAVSIDNSSPTVTRFTAVPTDEGIRVSASVRDASRLSEAEIAVDGGVWRMLPAVDGIVDDFEEQFAVELSRAELPRSWDGKAARVVAIRVTDDAGNVATRSVVIAPR